MEPIIYKPGTYNTPGVYKGAGDIYKGRGVYNEGGGLFVEIGGRKYPVVKIGTQLWITKNLDWKFPYNGGTLPIGPAGVPTTPAAWYFDNDENTYGLDGTYKCGLLYNWYAAKYLDDNKGSLLPDGWHVPTSNDFNILTNSIGGTSIAGTKLKALDNSIIEGFPIGWNGTNDYKFSAIPSGGTAPDADPGHIFYEFGTYINLWTLTTDNDKAYNVYIGVAPEFVFASSKPKTRGFSIRLVKDA